MSKVSNKLNFIDQQAYDKIHDSNKITNLKPMPSSAIRNSKYKKTQKRAKFTLLDFVKVKQPKDKQRPRRVIITRTIVPIKKRGKTREGGKKRRYTRLKKSILRCRQQKMLLLQEERDSSMMALLEQTMSDLTIKSIHSRRFREYCDNCTTTRLSELTEQLLRDLHRFQKRAFTINEIKARAHRRYVLGFRETEMYLQVKKVKLIIIAPDCEPCKSDDGLDEKIASLKEQCNLLKIPYLFSLRRRQLSYVFYKKVPISCVGVLDFDGANETFKQLLEELAVARAEYKIRISSGLSS